jgi:hypothetical protein
MSRPELLVVLMIGLVFAGVGCTAPESSTESAKPQTTAYGEVPVVGGVAVGLTPKLINASLGENASFTVDLLSSENADDVVTVSIRGAWINKTFTRDIEAGEELSIPVQINIPQKADNTTVTVSAASHNLNSTSSTTGLILINREEVRDE